MEEQPNYNVELKCVWNRLKTIPDTSIYNIIITIETSVEVESIKSWLLEFIGNSMKNIASQTGANEQLISIETIKL